MGKTTKKEEAAASVQEEKIIEKAFSAESAGPAGKTQAKKPKAMGPWMYVGPTISGIGIQNRVYTEIPKDAEERAEEVPEINHLFIPVASYPTANKMLREKKGYIYSAFCKVDGLRNGGNEV